MSPDSVASPSFYVCDGSLFLFLTLSSLNLSDHSPRSRADCLFFWRFFTFFSVELHAKLKSRTHHLFLALVFFLTWMNFFFFSTQPPKVNKNPQATKENNKRKLGMRSSQKDMMGRARTKTHSPSVESLPLHGALELMPSDSALHHMQWSWSRRGLLVLLLSACHALLACARSE